MSNQANKKKNTAKANAARDDYAKKVKAASDAHDDWVNKELVAANARRTWLQAEGDNPPPDPT